MPNLLTYLLQSTLCLSLFWLMFRLVMRKEHHFGLTRMLLLTIVLLSAAIPGIQLPLPMQSTVRVELPVVFAPVEAEIEAVTPTNVRLTSNASIEIPSAPSAVLGKTAPSIPQLLFYGYLTGCLISLLLLIRGLVLVLLLTRKARSITMEGFRLLVVEREIPAFSFGRWVVLSQSDYTQHRLPLLAHEQAHIRLCHFYDLLLLETVRIFHWFNPVIYWLIRDLKEIHEFQADDYTLTNGIDATQYQLLIIQKGVGSERFALANSFNQCQIKNRITMMNKSKTNKAGGWKVAIFLPLLALLLMAFGRKTELLTEASLGLSSTGKVFSQDSARQWSEADFLSPDGFKALKKQSKTPQWIEADLSNFTMHGKAVTAEKSKNSGEFIWVVQIDSKSRISISHHNWDYTLTWKQFQDSIRSRFDYDFANGRTKPNFRATLINGVSTMAPGCFFQIVSDKSTSLIDYQRFLNTIGKTVLEIRGKYSKELYKMDYSSLNLEQKEQMDIIIPLVALFNQSPQLQWEAVILKDSLNTGSKTAEGKANLNVLDSTQTKLYVVDGTITEPRRAKYFMEVGVESITVLNGKDATDKYGEKGKNGVFEIILKKSDGKERNHMATENMVKSKVTDSNSKFLDDASYIVTGKVTLSDGRPLQRVPVRIKGSNTRTLTDKDGLFKMADVPRDCILEFQNVGLKSTTAKPDFEKPMNVKMELGSFGIDRVKVICQANDSHPPKPLPKHGFASNMTASPLLFVLDGVIVDKTKMDQIEPDDVKSVSILNAKSATEKYGQLAKNGVMEIQTKGKVNLSAENGKVVVEVNEYADGQKMELHSNNIVDEMPEFKGSMKGLMNFISGNIKYPDKAQANKTQGNVEVNFVINRDGKVEHVSIANAVEASLDAEAIRVISSMPDWNPGKQSGDPVDVAFTIPIQFAIK